MERKHRLPLSPRVSPVGRERTPTPEIIKSPVAKWITPVLPLDDSAQLSASPVVRMVISSCRSCQQRMQTAVDLLLNSAEVRPAQAATVYTLNRSFGRYREKLLSLTRDLSTALRSLASLLSSGLARTKETCICLEEVCDAVVLLADACAHTVYVQAMQNKAYRPIPTSLIDRYQITCSIASIERKLAIFRRASIQDLDGSLLKDICRHLTDCVETIEHCCAATSPEVNDEEVLEQLRLCSSNVRASSEALKGVIRQLKDQPSIEMLICCQAFADSVIASCHSLIAFVGTQHLSGHPVKMEKATQHKTWNLLTSTMGVITPCLLMCNVIRSLVDNPTDSGIQAKAQGCVSVANRGSVKLAKVLGVTVVDIN